MFDSGCGHESLTMSLRSALKAMAPFDPVKKWCCRGVFALSGAEETVLLGFGAEDGA